MIKVNVWLAFFMIVSFCSIIMSGKADGAMALTHQAYILYDAPVRYGDRYPLITALSEHLAHLGFQSESDTVEDWQEDKIGAADVVVVVGLRDTTLSPQMLEALAAAHKVVWFERNIEQLAACLHWQDFRLGGPGAGWSYVKTNVDQYFPEWLQVIRTSPGGDAHIIASLKNAAGEEPLAWQRGNVCYCGLLETNPVFMTTLGTILRGFFPNSQPMERQVLLRVEDVSPFSDPATLAKLVASIKKYHIPFAIAVTPVGVGADGERVAMHERQELLNVLQDAQADGASIIMHGYIQENEVSSKNGGAYEFWNERDDKPLKNAKNFTEERLEAGIAELVRCNLVPVAFEPPHYAMSKDAYTVLSGYFNILSGQVQVSDDTDKALLSLPYDTISPYLNGMRVIPENMGYYDGTGRGAADILQVSGKIADLPDGLAGLFYHGYLSADGMPQIIEGVKAQGYSFLDLRQQDIRVQSSKIHIRGKDGGFSVSVDPDLKASWKDTPTEKNIMKKVGAWHIALLLVLISGMIACIWWVKNNARRKYEIEHLPADYNKRKE